MEKLDVVYMKPDIASLFGAVSLAAGGLKVLVLDDKLQARVLKSEDGTEVSPPPEPFLWRGLKSVVFLEPLLNRLKLLTVARDKVKHVNPSLQVVTPDARLDYFSPDAKLSQEFAREFGRDDENCVISLLNDLHEIAERVYELAGMESFPPMPMSFAERLFKREADCRKELEQLRDFSFEEVLRNSGVSEPVRTLFYSVIAAFEVPMGKELPACAAALVLGGIHRGIYRADEPALREILISTFKKKGGYTLPMADLETVEMDKGGISALRMSKSNYIYSRLYVAADRHFIKYVPDKYKARVVAGARLHILTIMAREGAVPVGMRDRVVVVNRKAEPLYPEHVARVSIAETTQADGNGNIFFTVESLQPSGIDSVETELWEALRGVAPFIDDYVVSHRYDVEHSTFRARSKEAFFELPVEIGAPNLLPTEDDLLAQMGMGKGVISGRILARVILKKLGLRAKL